MLNQRTLLALAFGLFFCFTTRSAQAQGYCSEVIGMSVCDLAYPGTYATCVANDWLEHCQATDPDPDSCWDEYDNVWNAYYRSASGDCDQIGRECALMGGTRNASGGCDFPPPSGGGDCPGGDPPSSCHQEYIYVDVNYGDGNWITVWEGWVQVCE
jgi:hypothetical protein